MRVFTLIAGCFLLFASVSFAAINDLANNPKLVNQPIESLRYDDASRCKNKSTDGAKALVKWLDENVRGESWGINRCEKWSKGSYSVHSEGRAIDWHLDANNKKQRQAAEHLIDALLSKDRRGNVAALARRMGVQGLIYNCRSWFSSYSTKMGHYSYCYKDNGKKKPAHSLDYTQAHKDHIHIELNKPGARMKTSFWRSGLHRR